MLEVKCPEDALKVEGTMVDRASKHLLPEPLSVPASQLTARSLQNGGPSRYSLVQENSAESKPRGILCMQRLTAPGCKRRWPPDANDACGRTLRGPSWSLPRSEDRGSEWSAATECFSLEIK